LHQKYKQNNKLYWLESRILGTYEILTAPFIKPFISIKYPLNVLSVAIESFVNRFVFFIGLFACVFGIFRFKKDYFILMLLFIPIFLFAYLTVLNGYYVTRMLYVPGFFMLAFATEWLTDLIKKKKYVLLSLIFLGMTLSVIYDLNKQIAW
jgi:hypothetical protein